MLACIPAFVPGGTHPYSDRSVFDLRARAAASPPILLLLGRRRHDIWVPQALRVDQRFERVQFLFQQPREAVVLQLWRLLREHRTEELAVKNVVGPVLEVQSPGILEVVLEGFRVPSKQLVKPGALLLFLDLAILVLLRLRVQARPGQGAAKEVCNHVPDGLHVITAALLESLVCVDGCVPGGACEVEALAKAHVAVCFVVPVVLAQPKVDKVDVVYLALDAKHEVLRLDVAMDNAFGVQILDTMHDLLGNQRRSSRGELLFLALEAILEGPAEQLHYHAVMLGLPAGVEQLSKSLGRLSALRELFQDVHLVHQLMVVPLAGLKLHCHPLFG
mmetsp:Transcript_93262/g.278414  ORF Transcript_93262/g.278414 Transcript_93262/m.278414 type:complete len:332 (+) Transcript_93262:16-1011(+)